MLENWEGHCVDTYKEQPSSVGLLLGMEEGTSANGSSFRRGLNKRENHCVAIGNYEILTGLISYGKSSQSPQHLNEVCLLECGCNLDHRLFIFSKILELKAFANVVGLSSMNQVCSG